VAIKKDTLDQLLDGRDPKEVFNKDGLFDELKKALAERVRASTRREDHIDVCARPDGAGDSGPFA
jgi:putative transposase